MKANTGLPRISWKRVEGSSYGERNVPEETAIAIVHDAVTTAVMMATPADLQDFAVGFSLSEGVVDDIEQVRSVEIVEGGEGIEVRVWLTPDVSSRLNHRRRRIAGPTGCGLCGIDSLAEASRPPRSLGHLDVMLRPDAVLAAMTELEGAQSLGRATRAVHAAALWRAGETLLVREDVGRHNALDKLIGACAVARADTRQATLLLTSRVSVEMIQKASVLGAPVVCAVSAPTALAARTAEAAGITLVAVVRADGFEIFTRPDRVDLAPAAGHALTA